MSKNNKKDKIMKKRIRISLYCAEKNSKTGNGYLGKTISTEQFKTKEECDAHIKKIKDEQKAKNLKWRKEGKALWLKQKNNVVSSKQDNIQPQYRHSTFNKQIILDKLKKFKKIYLDKKTGNTTFFLGSSKSGKTTLLMKMYKKYYNRGFISVLFSPHYHKKGGSKCIIKLSKFDKRGEDLIKLQRYINRKCKNKYKFLNMFDDILNIRHSAILNNLILTYRNSNISSMICLQYPYLLSKGARSNINNVFCLAFNTDECIENVIKTFLQSFFKKLGLNTMNEMIAFYRKMTLGHNFIYIHPAKGIIQFSKTT